MTKKRKIEVNSIQEIDNKINELKLELAKYKGMLVSKTKVTNTSKKKEMQKEIARLFTLKNSLLKKKEGAKAAWKILVQ